MMVFWWTFLVVTLFVYVSIFAALIYFNVSRSHSSPEPPTVSSMFRAINPFEPGVSLRGERLERPVESWDDLASASDDVDYGSVAGSSSEEYLKRSDLPVFSSIYSRLERGLTVEEGLERVRRGKGRYFLVLDDKLATYHANQRPCDLEVMGTPHQIGSGWGLTTELRSTILDSINLELAKLLENGWFHRSLARYEFELAQCGPPGLLTTGRCLPWQEGHCSEGQGLLLDLPLEVVTFMPVLALVVLGVLLAMVLCCLEAVCFKCCPCAQNDSGYLGSPK